MNKHRLLFFLHMFTCSLLYAQSISFTNYNTNNSKLPHNIIYHLKQDHNGSIWICTDDGLVRLDGLEMKNYEIGFKSRYAIAADEEYKKMWVSTWKGGIYYLRNDTAIHVKTTDLPFKGANNIIVFDDILIAFDFLVYKVYKYDAKKELLRPIHLKLNNDATAASENQFNLSPGDKEYYHFLKTTSHQLFAYNTTGIYSIARGKFKLVTDKLKPDEIWESPEGKLYYRIGTSIYQTNTSFAKHKLIYVIPFEKLGNRSVSCFKILPSGNICIGTDLTLPGQAYFLINVLSGAWINLQNEVRSKAPFADMIIDNGGSMWISTDGSGLYHAIDRTDKR